MADRARRAWHAAGRLLLHGLDMLIEQAVLQVRVFTDADPDVPLPREAAVRAAMRAAVGALIRGLPRTGRSRRAWEDAVTMLRRRPR